MKCTAGFVHTTSEKFGHGVDYRRQLNDGRLGTGLEGVGQTALSAVLTVLMESHLHELWVIVWLIKLSDENIQRYQHHILRWGTHDEDAWSCHQSRPCNISRSTSWLFCACAWSSWGSGGKHRYWASETNYWRAKTYIVSFLLSLLGTTTEAEHQVKSRLLLDVVIAESATILELFASKDQALLIGGNAIEKWADG